MTDKTKISRMHIGKMQKNWSGQKMSISMSYHEVMPETDLSWNSNSVAMQVYRVFASKVTQFFLHGDFIKHHISKWVVSIYIANKMA